MLVNTHDRSSHSYHPSQVTGAAGFIGSHVAQQIMDKGVGGESVEVLGLDDLSGGYIANLPCGILFVEDDLSQTARLADIFAAAGPFKYVYHLAAYAAEVSAAANPNPTVPRSSRCIWALSLQGLSHFIRVYNYENNLLSSARLLNEVVRRNATARFVFASSIAVYGTAQIPFTEEMHPSPEDPYGIAKLAFEMDLEASRRMFGQDYAVLRPHNVYGKHQNIFDKYRNVVGIFMEHAMRGAPMPIFGDGSQTRAFSHVTDVARAFVLAATLPAASGKAVNVGSDQALSVGELARIVSRVMKVAHKITQLEKRDEVLHAVAHHALQREVFGNGDSVGLEEGLQEMAEWVRKHAYGSKEEDRPSFPWGKIEVGYNMPPSWVDAARGTGHQDSHVKTET